MAHLFISAAHKSSGKTTLSVGLAAAMTRRGKKVQTFKKGPDYIDPLWLQRATDISCYNLDFNTQTQAQINKLFAERMLGCDVGLIEGNKGLYDGVALDGHDSNAALAVMLNAPVILVIDVTGITRGIAPLLVGYRAFGPEVHIAGVIFNKVGSRRQEQKLRAAVERYTDMSVVGSVPRNDNILSPERHLGLVPPQENNQAYERISNLAMMVEKHINMDLLLEIAKLASLPVSDAPAGQSAIVHPDPDICTAPDIRIAIARDSAFGFYYADDLDALQQAGAELIFFNAIKDQALPAADGLFLGGGFPETHMQALEDNKALRLDILQKANAGFPVYAECGGMMYLARDISWEGASAQMVGFLPARVSMHEKPQGRGLVRLQETGKGLWPMGEQGNSKTTEKTAIITAHEFHYASLDGLPENSSFAYDVLRGHGIDGRHDGILLNNVQAGFCHHRSTGQNQWASRFVEFVRQCKKNSQ